MPPIPKEVAFYNDGFAWRYAHKDAKEPVLTQLSKPFENGYRSALFQVTEAATNGGHILPVKFEFTRFAPATQALLATDLVTIGRLECVATNIQRQLMTQRFVPETSRYRPLVSDERVKIGNAQIPVSYVQTNRTLGKATNDVISSKEYQRQAKTVSMRESQRGWAPWLAVSLLAAVTSFFVVAGIKWFRS